MALVQRRKISQAYKTERVLHPLEPRFYRGVGTEAKGELKMTPKEKAAPRQENSLQQTTQKYTNRKRPIGSRKDAIEQHCFDCLADSHEPGTRRQQVAKCTSKNCALWSFRPTAALTIPSRIKLAVGSERDDFMPISDGGK